jgi:hypothetical protein
MIGVFVDPETQEVFLTNVIGNERQYHLLMVRGGATEIDEEREKRLVKTGEFSMSAENATPKT